MQSADFYPGGIKSALFFYKIFLPFISSRFSINEPLSSIEFGSATRMAYMSPRRLLGLACLSLLVIVGATSTPSDPSTSPAADTELICPTEHAGDCYPRLFQPTKDFQLIKEGQDIPPGLHVRLNIYSGEKEARLNIPMEDDEGGALEDIPIEQAVVVVEQPEPTNEDPVQNTIPPNAPPYEAAGKIQPPNPNGGEIATFHNAKLTIDTEGPAFDTSLDDLSELAHDIYYGVEIAKDRPIVEKLVCYALGSGSERFPATENRRDYKAASILASAIQNNPTALEEVTKIRRVVTHPTCGMESVVNKASGKGGFVNILRNRLESEEEPSTLKAKVTLMSGLMKEAQIRDEFLQTGEMELLLAIWLKEGQMWDPVRLKVAQLVTDNFLDESMGAALGVWPKLPVSSSKACKTDGRALDDGCWEHHVEIYLKASPESSWARDFLKALQEQRPNVVQPMSHREL